MSLAVRDEGHTLESARISSGDEPRGARATREPRFFKSLLERTLSQRPSMRVHTPILSRRKSAHENCWSAPSGPGKASPVRQPPEGLVAVFIHLTVTARRL